MSMTSRDIMFTHISTHAAQVGFSAPEPLLGYLADMLDHRLTRTELTPQPSFAERYLELYLDPNPRHIQDYADTCLVWVSLVPEAGERRGIPMDYYATLGISSYYAVGDLTQDPRMTQLGNWFYHIQKFLNSAMHADQHLELFKF
jgi:hypothetical protein